MTRYRHLLAVAIVGVVGVAPLSLVRADATSTSDHVVMSEVQTATSVSASQEFIELYNPTSVAVSLAGWAIDYKAATSANTDSSWVKHASLTGVIPANGFYLVAPLGYLPQADADWSATLAGSGGNARLRDGSGLVVDQLGYGSSANAAEGNAPAQAPPAGQSIERLPGRLDESGGNGTDTNSNAADWVLRSIPQPQNTHAPTEVPGSGDGSILSPPPVEPPSADGGSGQQATDDTPAPHSYDPLDITELFVNPMTPLLDAHDEFIELFNPTSDTVDLAGYTLRTGSNFHAYYVLPETTLAPGAYMAFYSNQTKLSLVNSGGAAEVLDPSGAVVDVTPVYGNAPNGQSWARFDDGWHWTLQPTPGQPNVLGVAVTLAKASTATKAAPRSKAPKAAAAPKAKKKVAVKTKVTKKRTKKPKAAHTPLLPQLADTRSLQPASWLLIGLAALTIGYALYEFRYDLYNYYRRLRGYSAPSSGHRRENPEGDGD